MGQKPPKMEQGCKDREQVPEEAQEGPRGQQLEQRQVEQQQEQTCSFGICFLGFGWGSLLLCRLFSVEIMISPVGEIYDRRNPTQWNTTAFEYKRFFICFLKRLSKLLTRMSAVDKHTDLD